MNRFSKQCRFLGEEWTRDGERFNSKYTGAGILEKVKCCGGCIFEKFGEVDAKPYLVPVSTIFGELDSGLIMEIPLGVRCKCVASSGCGRFIAAGAGGNILVVKSGTGEILRRMRVHKNDVRS